MRFNLLNCLACKFHSSGLNSHRFVHDVLIICVFIHVIVCSSLSQIANEGETRPMTKSNRLRTFPSSLRQL